MAETTYGELDTIRAEPPPAADRLAEHVRRAGDDAPSESAQRAIRRRRGRGKKPEGGEQ